MIDMISILKNIWRTLFTTNDEVEGVDSMDMTNKIRKAARAQGRVQGVGFRFFVQTEAKKCHVTGWVKNESDGSVTMEIQGTPEQLATLEERIKRGNGFARVSSLESTDIAAVKGEIRFEIHY